MYKISICGHFGGNKEFNDGQTIKTKTIFNELYKKFGENNIGKIDTYNWKKNPLKLLVNCFKYMKNSDNVIILPATKRYKSIWTFICNFIKNI